jgi:hypothetical protein
MAIPQAYRTERHYVPWSLTAGCLPHASLTNRETPHSGCLEKGHVARRPA